MQNNNQNLCVLCGGLHHRQQDCPLNPFNNRLIRNENHVNACKCGSLQHSRTSSLYCPLNKSLNTKEKS